MVVKGIATEREEDLVLPACVGGRVGVGHTGDQVLDVQDPGSLKVEVSDHGVGLVEPGSSTPRARRSRRLVGRRADVLKDGGDELPVGGEEALRLGDPASKSVSRGALMLPGEGNHTHTLMGSSCLGLGALQGRSKGAVGGGDGSGTRRLSEEGGAGEGRVWGREVGDTRDAKGKDASCAHERATRARSAAGQE